MKRFSALLGCLLFAGAAAASDRPVVVAGGVADGVYGVLAQAICQQLQPTPCTVLASKGSVENVDHLLHRRADFALVQSDVLFESAAAVALPPAPDGRGLRGVLALYAEPLTVLVKNADAAQAFGELKGRRIGTDPVGTGARDTLSLFIGSLNWSDDVRPRLTQLPPARQAGALCDGEVDALALVMGHPNRRVEDVMRACPVRLLQVDGPAVDTFFLAYPFYARVAIHAGTYPNQPEAVASFGTLALLATRDDVPAPLVHRLLEATAGRFDALAAEVPALAATGLPPAERGILPVLPHSAAAEYWKLPKR